MRSELLHILQHLQIYMFMTENALTKVEIFGKIYLYPFCQGFLIRWRCVSGNSNRCVQYKRLRV
jgi:hypothetical protein